MTCPHCASPCTFQEHLPTEELGTYEFECGSTRYDDGEFYRSEGCGKHKPETESR
jgi:hypothetical protein